MLKHLRIQFTLLLILLGFVGLFASSGMAGLWMLKENQRLIADLGRQGIEQANDLSDASLLLFQSQVALIRAKTYMEGGQTEQRDEALARANALLDRSAARFQQFGQNTQGAGDASYQRVADSYQALQSDSLRPLAEALQKWNGIEANRLSDQVLEPATQAFIDALDAYQSSNRKLAQQGLDQASRMSGTAMRALAALLVLSLVMAMGAHRIIRRTVLRPLSVLLEHFKRMAQGDLRGNLPIGGRNEIGALLAGADHMQGNLVQTVAGIRDAASLMRMDTQDIAHRSSQAADEIKALVEASDRSVAAGIGQVRQAGLAMDDILAAVGAVSERIDWIMQAAARQSNSIDTVRQVVETVKSDTQANLPLVRQTDQAADKLSAQAMRLHDIASVFQLEHAAEADAEALSQMEGALERTTAADDLPASGRLLPVPA